MSTVAGLSSYYLGEVLSYLDDERGLLSQPSYLVHVSLNILAGLVAVFQVGPFCED